jgi:glycogen synthase
LSLQKLHVAMCAWEIGRTGSGLGAKSGGLGAIVEELPGELVKVARREGFDLSIEILSPCFAHYDKRRLINTGQRLPAVIDGQRFEFEVLRHTFDDGQSAVYFWDDWQLRWTHAEAIYPEDTEVAFKLYASVSQAMAGYIRQGGFTTIHGHDYHVGLVPFYLGDDFLAQVPYHFTIHNATYQGLFAAHKGGYEALWRIGLPGERLFHKYFDFFNQLNFMKAAIIKTHETGGKVTTVSGDLAASWGYAAELRESEAQLYQRASAQKGGQPVREIFLPNRHLNVFEQLPIIGITNGLSDRNRPEQLPELKARILRDLQARQPQDKPLFRHPQVQQAMLGQDHNYAPDRLEVKAELKALLHLEAFGQPPSKDPILLTAVGRLVAQKNLGLVAEMVERSLAHDAGVKFLVLASAASGDRAAKQAEQRFFDLARRLPGQFYFNNTFNLPLSKLILAGGDFSLIPSRFEPCGLVDYEACLLGTLVIGRRTGGLAKVASVAYLYDWLDVGDYWGEAEAFFHQIHRAVDTYRHRPRHHAQLMRQAMTLPTAWESSARQYLQMYRFGLLMRKWWTEKARHPPDPSRFVRSLGGQAALFDRFYNPLWGDSLDWELKRELAR